MENFSVDEVGGDVESAIFHLYKNGMFTDVDVVFITENKRFPVHKLILASRSPVFELKFYAKNRVECDVVYIEGFKLPAVKNMISFFYGEPLLFENIHDIKETMRIAEEYKVKELSNICIEEINNVAVDETDLLSVLYMSMKYENENKQKECLEIVSRSPETVFASKLFKEMEFGSVCQVFEKLQKKGCLTDVQYLSSALKWMAGSKENKPRLMEKMETFRLSRDEFIDIIITYPDFFTSVEISNVFEKIKLTANDMEQESMESEVSAETRTADEITSSDAPLNEQVSEVSIRKNKLNISISDAEEGAKQALLTFEDNIGIRCLRFKITENLNEGIFASLSQENGEHKFDDVNISYEGLYFMLNWLCNGKKEMSPVNYSEVLRAAIFFELESLQEECVLRLGTIVDYDPKFLNGLREFPFLEDKLVELLRLETKNIFLHPNFFDSGVEVIRLLLTQPTLSIPSEHLLLVETIAWLEARNRQHWEFRSSLLSEIAFESLTRSDLVITLEKFPNFFTRDEINSILAHKEEASAETKARLPQWYCWKNRNFLK